MIVKKVKHTKQGKSKAWQIGDMVDYIRYPHNTNSVEKIAHAGSRNFLTNTHAGQKMEMIVLAQESVHSQMPVQHWIFSWKDNEQPTREQVDELVDIFLERMGLTEHQTVYGLHYNTENYHVRIAVNRMHPLDLKVVRPNNGFDIKEGHRIVAIVEQKQGWASEENTHYTVLENGDLARAIREKKVQPRPEARRFECTTGEKSAQRIAQERGYDIIKNAQSWTELHQKLGEQGLRFEKKGSGAIIFVGDIAVKASSVDRDFGMSKLCKWLGNFIPAPVSATDTEAPQKLTPEPVSIVNLEEWQEYQKELLQEQEVEETATVKRNRLEELKLRHRREREQLVTSKKHKGLPAINKARRSLKLQQQHELRRTRQELRPVTSKMRPHFETWLRRKGLSVQADRWRYRAHIEKAQAQITLPKVTAPQTVQHTKQSTPEGQLFERYATAINADRVRVTCIRMEPDGSKKVFILDKKGGTTTPGGGFMPEELQSHIPEMLRLQQRGENIYYTPLSEKRHHILIDDMTRESMEKLYEDGFRPAVVLESSPGNYQCVLTIPKLQSPHDRDVGNRITERLNRLYGDPKLSGCIHPHRAPAFGNLKPKHRQPDGSFPTVRLLQTEKRECAKALQLAININKESVAAEAKRHTPAMRPIPHVKATLLLPITHIMRISKST